MASTLLARPLNALGSAFSGLSDPSLSDVVDYRQFQTFDVFTTEAFLGNPLAVVFLPSNDSMTSSQKKAMAKEFNFVETIFIHPALEGSNKRPVDIYTTQGEIEFAGHPIIGAAFCLFNLSDAKDSTSLTLVTKAGPIEATKIPFHTGGPPAVKASIPCNETHLHLKEFPIETLLKLQPGLSKYQQSLATSFPIFNVVQGMAQVHIELPELDALKAVITLPSNIDPEDYLDPGWHAQRLVSYFYVDMHETIDGAQHIRTRNIYGKGEDPVTGSAACGLCARLALKSGKPGLSKYHITQGVEIGRCGDLRVDVTINADGIIQSIMLAGTAVRVTEGQMCVPNPDGEGN
ncbi:putative phenazine biosynthesis-like protein [Annulohypoxylon nitens]|nr:putative phenazine biosynthesis-like protein [Annulohypoxylon nitens]